MNTRYAPPGAEVHDIVSTQTQPVRLWPPSGRIGRLRLLAYSVAVWIVSVAFNLLAGVVLAMVGSGNALAMVIAWIGTAASLVAWWLLLIQRSHDMGWSGWWSLLTIIPLVGLVWVFKAGDSGANRYGAPPPPNTVMVGVLGLLMPVLVAGILAAVALPAYQAYTIKARAAQGR